MRQILFVGQIQIMQGVTPETLLLERNLHLISKNRRFYLSKFNGGGGSNLYDPNHFINVGGPKRVGGTGSLRGPRGGNGAEFVLLNGGSDFAGEGTSMSESATQLDVVHHLWDGTSGSTIAQTKNADDITLPSHTGSTQVSFLINLLMGKCSYSC